MSDSDASGLIERRSGESWPDLYDRQQNQLIDALALEPWQKKILHYRWLGAIWRIERAANAYRRKHNGLRIIAIVGGVLVSGFVAGGVPTANDKTFNLPSLTTGQMLSLLAFVVSLAVTAAVTLDEYFRYGDRYRESRLVAEKLRIEGSRFAALTDRYARSGSHAAAFAPFMKRIEDMLERDAEEWVGFAAEKTELLETRPVADGAAPVSPQLQPQPDPSTVKPHRYPPASSGGQRQRSVAVPLPGRTGRHRWQVGSRVSNMNPPVISRDGFPPDVPDELLPLAGYTVEAGCSQDPQSAALGSGSPAPCASLRRRPVAATRRRRTGLGPATSDPPTYYPIGALTLPEVRPYTQSRRNHSGLRTVP